MVVSGEDTVDDHLRRLEKIRAKRAGKGKKTPKKKAVPAKLQPPEELAYLLFWYKGCRRGQHRGMALEPLSNQEILAYKSLHHLDEMDSFDVDTLYALDGVWQKVQNEHRERSKPPKRR